jgi:asparagine synthase (glutamine-hydrolysing)
MAEAYFATLIHLKPGLKPWLYDRQLMESSQQAGPQLLADLKAKGHRSPLAMMLDNDVNHYLPDDLLVKMDVATMAHSLEARSPLLDHELMEFAARLPDRMKMRGRTSKYLLKTAMRGILPDEVIDRPKMGFGVPLGDWLRTSLKPLLMDTVLSERARSRGYFQPEALKTLVDTHLQGDNRYQYVLWDLALLELWHRMFIDQRPAQRQVASGNRRVVDRVA